MMGNGSQAHPASPDPTRQGRHPQAFVLRRPPPTETAYGPGVRGHPERQGGEMAQGHTHWEPRPLEQLLTLPSEGETSRGDERGPGEAAVVSGGTHQLG